MDITNVDFKSSRVTYVLEEPPPIYSSVNCCSPCSNVLNPEYIVNGMKIADDPLSRPLVPHRKREPNFTLKTDDIEGASCTDPAAAIVAGIVMAHRRNFRDTNITSDITGAKADTHLHSIRSNRRVDPNAPQYSALDGSRVDASAISVGKSIVFAGLVHQHEQLEAAHRRDSADPKPYVASGVGNVGLLGSANRHQKTKRTPLYGDNDPPPRTAPVNAGKVKTDLTPAITNGRGSKNAAKASVGAKTGTRTERQQANARREEIQLVRELS